MIAINSARVEALIKKYKTKLDGFSDALKIDLEVLKVNTDYVKEQWQKVYIDEIIAQRAVLLTANLTLIKTIKPTFDDIVIVDIMKSTAHKKFRDKLIQVIGYSDRRSDFYPEYFKELGIKACVYCNSQFTVSVDAVDLEKDPPIPFIKAKYQVDHFIAKTQYPCFSISLYNLYPVCGTCNLAKRTSDVNFELYNEDENAINTSIYSFGLEDGSAAKYLADYKQEFIKIKFTDPDKGDSITPVANTLEDTFDILGIYLTQIDVAEEVIVKSQIYNDSYKNRLRDDFPKLFNLSNLSNRVMLGTYTDEDDIHRRPMAKFIQDIAKGLGMI